MTVIRWIAGQRWRLETRVTAFIDSQVVYFTISCGRFGSQRPWQLSKKLGAYLLGTQTRVVSIWVKSEDSPVDAPLQRF